MWLCTIINLRESQNPRGYGIILRWYYAFYSEEVARHLKELGTSFPLWTQSKWWMSHEQIFSQPTRHSVISKTRADGLPSFFGGQVSPPLIGLLLKICPGGWGVEVGAAESKEVWRLNSPFMACSGPSRAGAEAPGQGCLGKVVCVQSNTEGFIPCKLSVSFLYHHSARPNFKNIGALMNKPLSESAI